MRVKASTSKQGITQVYPLYNPNEFRRSETQNSYPQYDINTELNDHELSFTDGTHILDAGCGSGTVTKKILQTNMDRDIRISAVDLNPDIIAQTRHSLSPTQLSKVDFVCDDVRFLSLVPYKSIDAYFSRFVFEYHPSNAQKIADNAFRVLRPGGSATIIDADNVLLGLKTSNKQLNKELQSLRKHITNYTDEICAHIPRFLLRAGFKLAQPQAIPVIFFNQQEKAYEHQIFKQRLKQMKPTLLTIWPEKRVKRFIEIFLAEILKPETLIRYEKFVFRALKN